MYEPNIVSLGCVMIMIKTDTTKTNIVKEVKIKTDIVKEVKTKTLPNSYTNKNSIIFFEGGGGGGVRPKKKKKKCACLRSPDPPYFSAADPNLFYQQLFDTNFC